MFLISISIIANKEKKAKNISLFPMSNAYLSSSYCMRLEPRLISLFE